MRLRMHHKYLDYVNSAVPLGMNSVHNWPLAQLLALEPRVRVGTDNGIT